MLRKREARRPPAAGCGAEMLFVGVEPAVKPVEFVIFAYIVRALVQIAVEGDFVTVLDRQIDRVRALRDHGDGHGQSGVQVGGVWSSSARRDRMLQID